MIDLDHPWTDAGQRQVFRAVLDAWSRPGTIAELSPWSGAGCARLAVLAALCDAATTLHDAHGLLAAGDRSRLAAQPAGLGEAAFVLADGLRAPQDAAPQRGTLLNPEHGATLVLQCQAVGEGPALRLSGPGIAGSSELRVLGVDARWWQARAAWCAFPLGIDIILCDARRVACMPRAIAVEA